MYQQKPLGYAYQDLEPFIDTHTMGLHYNKHQANYLNRLNALLKTNRFDFSYPMEELYKNINSFQPKDRNDILYNLGGVLNHNLYFETISPKEKEEPSSSLEQAINEKYGSYEEFQREFQNLALGIKGSGYVFLVRKKDNTIDLMVMLNQDSPIEYGVEPLLNIDMWEHAYYLNYKNNKQEYLDNFFEIINFRYANKQFEK